VTSRRKPDACKTLAATASVWTDENTVGLDADFYRAGDGNDESFTAQMIVSAEDIAPDIAGIQNVWIQGVGCASAIANANARERDRRRSTRPAGGASEQRARDDDWRGRDRRLAPDSRGLGDQEAMLTSLSSLDQQKTAR
jgi:hypothetical protein